VFVGDESDEEEDTCHMRRRIHVIVGDERDESAPQRKHPKKSNETDGGGLGREETEFWCEKEEEEEEEEDEEDKELQEEDNEHAGAEAGILLHGELAGTMSVASP
jgi:hypothetical protein